MIPRFEAEKHIPLDTVLNPKKGTKLRVVFKGGYQLNGEWFYQIQTINKGSGSNTVFGRTRVIQYRALVNGYDVDPYRPQKEVKPEKGNGKISIVAEIMTLKTKVDGLQSTVARLVEKLGGLD